MLNIIVVACGGAIGAAARYLTVTTTQHLLGMRFPYGTIFVNCLGSLLFGLFASLIMERLFNTEYLRLFVIVGFLGGYTTFSSFAWETLALYNGGQWLAALLNVLLTNVITLVMLVCGLQIGRLAH